MRCAVAALAAPAALPGDEDLIQAVSAQRAGQVRPARARQAPLRCYALGRSKGGAGRAARAMWGGAGRGAPGGLARK